MTRFGSPKASRGPGSGARKSRPRYRPVPGSGIEPRARANIVGRPDPLRRIEVTLLLRPGPQSAGKQPASVDELAAQLPQERRYLTREALASAYGADRADAPESSSVCATAWLEDRRAEPRRKKWPRRGELNIPSSIAH
jgi:hypothetical protein